MRIVPWYLPQQDQSNHLDSFVQLNQNTVGIVYSNEGSNFYLDSSGFVPVYQKTCVKPGVAQYLKTPEMKRLSLFVCLITSLSSYHLSAQNNSWKFRHDQNGIQVFTRKDSTSNIVEIKFRTEVKASLNAVVAMACDIPNLKNWSYRLKESYQLKEVSETEGYLYMYSDFPFPFSDRDMIVHYIMKQDPNTKQVTFVSKSVYNAIPEKDGVVRIKTIESKWIYTPLPNGVVRLEYQLKSDPGGNIPNWLINLAADDGPLKSIAHLKEFLPKYENAKVDFLK